MSTLGPRPLIWENVDVEPTSKRPGDEMVCINIIFKKKHVINQATCKIKHLLTS